MVFHEVEKLAAAFKEIDNKLTTFERYSLAIQIQRNQLLATAFVVSDQPSTPTAPEKIAMELEGIKSFLKDTSDATDNISSSLSDINQNHQ